MDWQFITTFIKIALFLPFILVLIYISAKLGGSKLQSMQNGRFVKILERVSLSKDNSILAVKIGSKGYIVSSSNGRIEVMMELKDEELIQVEKTKMMSDFLNINQLKNTRINTYLSKLNFKKEDKNE